MIELKMTFTLQADLKKRQYKNVAGAWLTSICKDLIFQKRLNDRVLDYIKLVIKIQNIFRRFVNDKAI